MPLKLEQKASEVVHQGVVGNKRIVLFENVNLKVLFRAFRIFVRKTIAPSCGTLNCVSYYKYRYVGIYKGSRGDALNSSTCN